MKWTVLSDNRTNNDLLQTEHGLSILLETEKHRFLLDTGASDVFIRNAERLNIDLTTVDYVFISHGHIDHAGGLRYLMEINQQAKIIVSPDAISGKFYSKRGNLHSITTQWPEGLEKRIFLIDHSQEVADGIHVIAHIPHVHPMPKGNQNLYVLNTSGDYVHDDFRHELALYVDGLLFTGCAHSGLENILAACPWPVHSVVGGFHLLDANETEEELTSLAMRLKVDYPHTQFYTSHCTGDNTFATMKAVMEGQLHAFSCGTTQKERAHVAPSLIKLSDAHTAAFKEEMQEAFQHGFEAYNKDAEETNQWQVLPDKDFYQSLEAEGAEAYEAVIRRSSESHQARLDGRVVTEEDEVSEDGQRVGGAIITANGNMGELAFLYVKVGVQSKGIGLSIWKAIEAMHPEIEVWETCTPYFDRRNIHFYINRCGFHAVEFFNEHHPDPNMPEQFDQEDGLFKFEKKIR